MRTERILATLEAAENRGDYHRARKLRRQLKRVVRTEGR